MSIGVKFDVILGKLRQDDSPSGGAIGGMGTPPRYAKFTAPQTIGDGLLDDDGINTITTYADIVPTTNNTKNLGTALLTYANLYLAGNLNYITTFLIKSGGVQKLSLDTNGFMLFNNNQGLDVIGTGGIDTLNIGTANADVINIGWSGANVNIMGNTFYENVTQLQVKDKLFTVNKGGAVASGNSAGFEIEEGGVITGQFSTNGTRTGWTFLAPAIANSATLNLANLLADQILTVQNASGTIAYLTDITTNSWLTNGNVNGSLKYIGTNDNFDFPIRVNGIECARFQTGTGALGINTTTPNEVSLLDVVSTTKGVLFPRMTTAQRNAIVAVEALLVYDTDIHQYFYYNGTDWLGI